MPFLFTGISCAVMGLLMSLLVYKQLCLSEILEHLPGTKPLSQSCFNVHKLTVSTFLQVFRLGVSIEFK